MKEVYRLIDIIDTFIPGDWGDENPSAETPVEVSCIRGADIVPISNNEYGNIPTRYISERSSRSRLLQEGDIVIEKSGGSPTQSTGRVVYITGALLKERGNVVCSNFCTAFRIKSDWWSKYVFHYLQYVYDAGVFFNFEGKTSGLKNLDIDSAFKAIQIERISREEQSRKANAITLIEAKMALNRSINANLEAMAKQLYDYWFVQFDFPDEDGRPYKSSGGKMVWNEKLKREIPEGWNCVPLNQFADIVNGATPSTSTESNYGGDIVWITPKDLSDQKRKFIYKGERHISQQGYDSCSTSMLPVGTILMSSRAPIGLVSIARHELCTNQGFKSYVPKDINDSCYLYYYIKDHIPQIEQLGTGTTFKEVSREDVSKFPILTVGNALIKKEWLETVRPLFDEQFLRYQEIDALTKQRDELLPLLMNGQVSITK